MADLGDVLERLVNDPGFRRQLREDPDAALEGYDLDASERELLAAEIGEPSGRARGVEPRTSKSALGGMLAGVLSGGDEPAEPIGLDQGSMAQEDTDAPPDAAAEPSVNPMKIDGFLKVPDIPGAAPEGDDLAGSGDPEEGQSPVSLTLEDSEIHSTGSTSAQITVPEDLEADEGDDLAGSDPEETARRSGSIVEYDPDYQGDPDDANELAGGVELASEAVEPDRGAEADTGADPPVTSHSYQVDISDLHDPGDDQTELTDRQPTEPP